jgi:hypothetical protein
VYVCVCMCVCVCLCASLCAFGYAIVCPTILICIELCSFAFRPDVWSYIHALHAASKLNCYDPCISRFHVNLLSARCWHSYSWTWLILRCNAQLEGRDTTKVDAINEYEQPDLQVTWKRGLLPALMSLGAASNAFPPKPTCTWSRKLP